MTPDSAARPAARPLSSRILSSRILSREARPGFGGSRFSGVVAALATALFVYLVGIVNELTGYALNGFGIVPRDPAGLGGILVSWAIHGNLDHLANNALPLAVLGSLVGLGGRAVFVRVSVFVVLTGGLLVWLLATVALHSGASGLVFGYLGYLVCRGWRERTPLSVLSAFLGILLYGGILIGMVPGQAGVSWESHLFGFVAGIVAGFLFRPRRRQARFAGRA